MIISTTDNIEGKKISEYLGLVSSSSFILAGGFPKKVNEKWSEVISKCQAEIVAQAAKMNADAIVGVTMGAFPDTFVYMTGTAIKFE